MPLDDDNPFQPRLESVPLLLTLDARSIPLLTGEAREQAEFLLELCMTPAVDGLWSWGGEQVPIGLPRTELVPASDAVDHRAVRIVGEGGFIGGIRMWSSHERLADTYELHDEARDWLIYYSTATTFHCNARRHFFVTADRRLRDELRGGDRQRRWQQSRVTTIPGALALAGRAMRASERIYYRAQPHYGLQRTTPYSVYFYLGSDLAPSRIRLSRWLEGQDHSESAEQGELEQSMHDRVTDLLRARDHIQEQNARHQNNATLDEILYHLRAAISGAAALFDSIAAFAHLALSIDPRRVGGRTRIGLHHSDFRRELRRNGAPFLASAAGDAAPLFKLVWNLRNGIMHGAGLTGSGYRKLDGFSAAESRVSHNHAQAAALETLIRHRRETRTEWGVSDFGRDTHVEPEAFGNRFCLVAIETAERLTSALAEDLQAPHHEILLSVDERQMIGRLRWLAGIPSQ